MKRYLIIAIMALGTMYTWAQSIQTYTFTIEGMTCQACANTAIEALQSIKGIDSVTVDLDSKVAVVRGNVTKEDIKKTLSVKTNFEVLFEGDVLIKPLSNEDLEKLDITVIKGGKKIKFKDHLAKTKITIFDFYADWCAPCRVFSPKLEHLVKNNPNVALRKVDIVSWKSNLSKQLTNNYKMPALPFTLIFNAKGKLLGKVEGNHIDEVKSIIKIKKE